MSAASTLASPPTASRGAVVAASRRLHPEARRVTGAGSAIVTTGDGIGLRSGGFEPSRSPPARGTLPITETEGAWLRVIPAWAGNTQDLTVDGGADQDRVIPAWAGNTEGAGHNRKYHPPRVIPAWAGNTAAQRRCRSADPGHPRVGGEHDAATVATVNTYGSSPRGRGTPLERPPLRGVPRVMGGKHSNCKQLICREFTACKRATEQYTRFGDAI